MAHFSGGHSHRRLPDSDRLIARRQFLAIAAGAAGSIAWATSSDPPALLWAEEFDTPLSLATRALPHARWRASDVWQPLDVGYASFGPGIPACWMANPEQRLGGVAYNPFSVHDSMVSISAVRTPPEALRDAGGCPWLGGMLMTNTDVTGLAFGYGYYEFRMRLPISGRGMFPALWFYAAAGRVPAGQAQAEIDLAEIFGHRSGRPWAASLHRRGADDPGVARQVVTRDDSTTAWHTYGLDWRQDRLGFYRDRSLIATVTGPDAAYFSGCLMSIRMDYSMDADFFPPEDRSDGSTPDVMTMDIDYVRQYDKPF